MNKEKQRQLDIRRQHAINNRKPIGSRIELGEPKEEYKISSDPDGLSRQQRATVEDAKERINGHYDDVGDCW